MRVRAFAAVLALAASGACADPAASYDAQHGRLLYETHCGACHTAQVHWRDKHAVRSWSGLLAEVVRWEKIAGQNWSEQDAGDVAAYLNGVYYKLRCPSPGCSGLRAALGRR